MHQIRPMAKLCSQRELRPRISATSYRENSLKTKTVTKCPVTGKRTISTQNVITLKRPKLEEPANWTQTGAGTSSDQSDAEDTKPHSLSQPVQRLTPKIERFVKPRIVTVTYGKPSGKIVPGMSPVIKRFVNSTPKPTKKPKLPDLSRVYTEKIEQDDQSDRKPQVLLEMDGYLWAHSDELDLERCLMGGQSFRWTKRHLGKLIIFTGIIKDHVFQLWRVSQQSVAFRVLNDKPDVSMQQKRDLLADYFRLNYELRELYDEWSKKDEYFAKCATQYKGFRILRQDPLENVFSFICATNNNIKRITQMVNNMCTTFGQRITIHHSYKATEKALGPFHKFPTVDRLAEEDVFDILRHKLSFGYRAKFIQGSARLLLDLSNKIGCPVHDYLLSLRKLNYEETSEKLMLLPGIGRKVADCISLMSMDHLDSVPVDVHIYQIVCRSYSNQWPAFQTSLKTPTGRPKVTKETHNSVRDFFKHLHGPLAGWSTSVLFIAELKHLKPTETTNIDDEKCNKQEMPIE